jgi:ankyrin repeat protein
MTRYIWKKILFLMTSFSLWLLILPLLLGWIREHGLLITGLSQHGSVLDRYREYLQLLREPIGLLMVITPWLLMTIIIFRRGPVTVLARMENAVKRGKLDEVSMLIDNGQDINASTAKGQTALHLAVEQDDVEMVGLLLDNGADFDLEDSQSTMAPLLTAAQRGQCDIVDLLIRFGANINSVTRTNDTPLHLAAAAGHIAVVDVLLKYRPALDVRNSEGKTALQLAEQRGNEPVAAVIRQYISRQWPYLKHSNG